MTSPSPKLTTRLVGYALIGIGLIGLIDAAAVSVLARSVQIGWSVLLLPAGFGLVRGNTGWVRPLLRVMQVWAVAVACVVTLAAFSPNVPFLADSVEVAGWGRVVIEVTALAEAALWVWVLGLGRRLADLGMDATGASATR